MKKHENISEAAALRQNAEESLKKKSAKTVSQLSEFETIKLIHELEVYHIELEMQNEELMLAKEQIAKAATKKYAELYDFAPSGYFTLSKEGMIIELNLSGAQMLGNERALLLNNPLGIYISNDTKQIFNLFLQKSFETKANQSCDVTLATKGNLPVYVHLSGIQAGNGEQCLLTMTDITQIKLEQENLRHSEERYKSLFQNNLWVMLLIDPETGEIKDANSAACTYYGWTHTEICRKNISEINTLSRDEISEEMQHAIAEKRNHFFFKHCLADGKVRDVEVYAGPIPFGNSKLLYSIVQDITGRKLAESKLKQNEDRFRQVVAQNQGVVWEVDADGLYTFVSSVSSSVYGYTPEELIGKLHFYDLHPVERREQFKEAAFEVFRRKGNFKNLVSLYCKPDKQEIYISTSGIPVLDENGNLTGYRGIDTDITERKKAEVEIKKSEENLNYAQEIANMGSWDFNLITNKYTWSRNNYNLVGLQPFEKEITIDYFMKLIHPDDLTTFNEKMQRVVTEKKVVNMEIRIIMPDGTERWIQNNVVPVFEGDSLITIKGVNIDITEKKLADNEIHNLNVNLERKIKERTAQLAETNASLLNEIEERKKVEEYLIAAKNEAEKANRAKSKFLSRMSHELRTPMNSILGFAQLMEMGDLKASHKKGVNHILTSGKHLLHLINEVLDISGIESGRVSLSIVPVALDRIIRETIDIVHPSASARHIKLELTSADHKQLVVKADHHRLRQVLLNLVGNAVKYNRDGGSVMIKTELQHAITPAISFVRISVTDTGSGISPEFISKLFLPFERIGAEKTEIEGTGLGLMVVKSLMGAMGGRVGVESVPGEGSTFWIELPHVEDHKTGNRQQAIGNGQETIPANDKTGTILYIEDNASNTELVEQILISQRSTIHLVCSTRGGQAVSLAIKYAPDLILLDLDLPDIQGFEVLRLLQAEEKTKEIPVVVISADAMPPQIEKLMKAGSKGYLIKPIDIRAFLHIVDKWVGSEKIRSILC